MAAFAARLSIATFLLIATTDIQALSWRLAMRDGAAPELPPSAIVHVRRIDAPADPIRLEVPVPSEGTLVLAEGTWEVSVDSLDVWAAPLYVTARQNVEILVHPAAQLRVQLESGAEPLPERLRVLVIPTGAQLQGERTQAEVSCPVVKSEMRCVVPAGTHDLRINADAFMPELRWDVRLPAGEITRIDPVTLSRGAAVIGTILKARRGALPPDARVVLVPVSTPPQQGKGVVLQARPNAKGVFTFASVAPGEYVLTASAKDLASDSRSIVVVANRTAELSAPLVLDTPKRVRVQIFPSTDPDGKKWAVELLRRHPGNAGGVDPVTGGVADLDGIWEQKGLRDAAYVLNVSRADESGQWASLAFDIAAADLDLPITITPTPVTGRISYGDRPIAARVHFGGDWARTRQVLKSDDAGQFEGLLPPAEKETWDIYVESDTPPIRRTLTDVRGRKDAEGRMHVDIELPATAVPGMVVDAGGEPVANAIVEVQPASGGRSNQVFSGPDGSFQLSGLEPGRYHVTGEAYLRMSELVELEVNAEDNAPLRIVMKDIQLLRGRVTVAGSMAVIGAKLYGVSQSSATRDIISGTSNETGAFTLLVPPDTTLMDMIIMSPGFATVIGRIPVKTDQPLLVNTAQHGGSLVLDTPDLPGVRLVRDGTQLHPRLVGSLTGGTAAPDGKRLRTAIPSLEPGHYSVCLGARCDSGYVPPHGTLTLSLRD